MYFFSRLLNPIRQLWMALTGPFQSLIFGIRNLATNNPIAQAGRYAKAQGQQLEYYRNLPGRFLDMLLPKSWRKRLGVPDFSSKQQPLDENGKPIDEATKAAVEGARRNTRRGAPPQAQARPRRMPWLIRKAEFSQIHVIDTRSGTREVHHIGSVIGQSKIELTLQSATVPPNPVVVRFTQADPIIHKAPMLVTHVSGKDVIQVRGRVARPTLPIEANTTLDIGGALYTVELYAWNRLAAVTRVDAAYATTLGVGAKGYDHNEDAIGVYQDKRGYLFCVADGVGSGYAPDEISAYATKYMLTAFKRNLHRPVDYLQMLQKAFDHINREVRYFTRKIENENEKGATTLTAVVIRSWEAHVGHIGDSRLYLLREGRLEQMTRDDAVEEERENSVNDPTKRTIKVQRLTQAIGRDAAIQPTTFSFKLQPQDRLLLCTDGVSRFIRTERLRELMQTAPLPRLPEMLIRESVENGSHDNISAVVIQVLEHAYPRDNWKATPAERVFLGNGQWSLRMTHPNPQFQTQYWTSQQRGCVTAAAGVLVVIAVIWGLLHFTNRSGVDIASSRTRVPITLQPEQIDFVRAFFGLAPSTNEATPSLNEDQASDGDNVENTNIAPTETLVFTEAATAAPTMTNTAIPTEVEPTAVPAASTHTLTPSVTAQSPTAIVPTSTLRPRNRG